MKDKPPAKFKFAGSLSLPADVWRPDHTTFKMVDAQADSRTGLFSAAVGAIMKGLGWGDGEMLVGLLIDFLNHFPDEARMAFVAGVVQGLGLAVKRDGEYLFVDMVQTTNALTPGPTGEAAEKRTPSGLILPGR
jgi:hypothetical protein